MRNVKVITSPLALQCCLTNKFSSLNERVFLKGEDYFSERAIALPVRFSELIAYRKAHHGVDMGPWNECRFREAGLGFALRALSLRCRV